MSVIDPYQRLDTGIVSGDNYDKKQSLQLSSLYSQKNIVHTKFKCDE